MNDTSRQGMLEATRLTRAGRLDEATELLQRLLRGEAVSTGNSHGEGGARTIALVPWTGDAEETFCPGADELTAEGPAQMHMPEKLRSFIDRISSRIPRLLKRSPAPAAAPELLPEGGQFIEAVYGNPAGSRTYKLYIPSTYRGEALPLVIMLHGCTQSPDDFAAGTRMNVLAEERGCFVVYPGQAASANPSKCWNWFKPSDQRRDAGEPSLIAGITRQVMRDYAVDPHRVYVAGLSAGAAAAAIMGMTYPDLYAAIGVHSGLACGAASDLPSAFAAMQKGGAGGLAGAGRRVVPTIVFHGDEDTTVHPRNGDLVIAQSRTAMPLDLHMTVDDGRVPGGHAWRRTLHTDAGGQAVLEQWVIHGGGHAWSGGSTAGSFTDPHGPDATREMLRFFLGHIHPAPAV